MRINGQVVKPSQKIKPGDVIAFDIPKAEPLELKGESIPLEILHEDDALLVLNKPAGLVVHPAPPFPPRSPLVPAAAHPVEVLRAGRSSQELFVRDAAEAWVPLGNGKMESEAPKK